MKLNHETYLKTPRKEAAITHSLCTISISHANQKTISNANTKVSYQTCVCVRMCVCMWLKFQHPQCLNVFICLMKSLLKSVLHMHISAVGTEITLLTTQTQSISHTDNYRYQHQQN